MLQDLCNIYRINLLFWEVKMDSVSVFLETFFEKDLIKKGNLDHQEDIFCVL